jgi:hypothetical protein
MLYEPCPSSAWWSPVQPLFGPRRRGTDSDYFSATPWREPVACTRTDSPDQRTCTARRSEGPHRTAGTVCRRRCRRSRTFRTGSTARPRGTRGRSRSCVRLERFGGCRQGRQAPEREARKAEAPASRLDLDRRLGSPAGGTCGRSSVQVGTSVDCSSGP